MILSLFKNTKKINLFLRKSLHSHFDPKLNSLIEINSLKTVINNRTDQIKLDFARLKGVSMRLRFYDSHRYHADLKFNESSLKTVLILPSGEFKIED